MVDNEILSFPACVRPRSDPTQPRQPAHRATGGTRGGSWSHGQRQGKVGMAWHPAVPFRNAIMLIDSLIGSQVARTMVEVSFDVADAGKADRVDELEVLVARHEARVADARRAFASGADLASRVRDGREPAPEAERSAAIEVLLGVENAFAEMGRLVAERALANERHAAAAAPRFLALLQRMTVLMDEEVRLQAEAARDLRWALLELEAAAEPPADGPVLSSPAELSSFLQGLRAPS